MTIDEYYEDFKATGYVKDTFQQEVIWLEEYIENYCQYFDIFESEKRLAALKRLVSEMDSIAKE